MLNLWWKNIRNKKITIHLYFLICVFCEGKTKYQKLDFISKSANSTL